MPSAPSRTRSSCVPTTATPGTTWRCWRTWRSGTAASTPAAAPSELWHSVAVKPILRALYAAVAVYFAVKWFTAALPQLTAAMHKYPQDGNIDWLLSKAFADGFDPYSAAGLLKVQRPSL